MDDSSGGTEALKEKMAERRDYHMDRPFYRNMAGSYDVYQRTGDLADRVPHGQRDEAHRLHQGPIQIGVYTHGAPRISAMPAGDFHGYGITESERERLDEIGDGLSESSIYPSVILTVDDVDEVHEIARMKEVYAITPPIPVATGR